MFKGLRVLIGFMLLGILFGLETPSYSSEERAIVGYGGVYTAGAGNNYPIYTRNKLRLATSVQKALGRMSQENKLPFSLIFETDSEERKKEINTTYSLAVVLTRDDVAGEKFATPVATIYKSFVNVGLVVLIYQTERDSFAENKEKNAIVFSTPLVGYSMVTDGQKELSPAEADDLFIKTSLAVLEDHLSKRLAKISLGRIHGEVTDFQNGKALINAGSIQGLVSRQNISFLRDNKKIASGTIDELRKSESIVRVKNPANTATKGMRVYGENIKGISDETYQVVEFRVSSPKILKLYQEKALGAQISQWFSDFLVDRSGKVVFPPKVGGEWAAAATESSFAVLMKDGQEHIFEVPPPKYPIHLDLSGVASKRMESNNVNEIWVYKAWMRVEIPRRYSKEFSDQVPKKVIPGIQSYQEKDEVLDLIHNLCGKIAKEANL